MKNISLFSTAGLLFFTVLAQFTLPDWYYLLVKAIATATAFYTAYHIRRSSLLDACGFIFMPFILMALMPTSPVSAEPMAQFWLLLMAANFIRMGVDYKFSPEAKQEKA